MCSRQIRNKKKKNCVCIYFSPHFQSPRRADFEIAKLAFHFTSFRWSKFCTAEPLSVLTNFTSQNFFRRPRPSFFHFAGSNFQSNSRRFRNFSYFQFENDCSFHVASSRFVYILLPRLLLLLLFVSSSIRAEAKWMDLKFASVQSI